MPLRTAVWTAAALVAFAANSILNRLALGQAAIDAASFSSVRLVSGAATLAVILRVFRRGGESGSRGSWLSAAMLTFYAVAFSFAYLSLSAGTGALILFGSVQATMILYALRSGERPGIAEWIGLAVAVAGLVYLVLPGLTAPSPAGSALMAIAGVSWGVYSLRGRGTTDPLADTAFNFLRSVPFVLLVSLFTWSDARLSAHGTWLALLSGSLASGVGYVVWYAALREMTGTRAATVQLSVPVLASIGGVIVLAETITARLVVAGALILGGVGLATTFSAPRTGRGPSLR